MKLGINNPFVIPEKKEYDPYVQSRTKLRRIINGYMPLHKHEFYEFLLVTAGTITHVVNEKQSELKEGNMLFIRKNDLHGAGNQSIDYEHINVSFSEDTLNELAAFFGPGLDMKSLLESEYPPMVQLTKHDELNLRSRMSELLVPPGPDQLLNKQFSKQELRTKSRYLISHIFIDYFSNVASTRLNIPFWLEHTYNVMKQPENFIAGYDRMIEISGYSPEHLSRCFKKYYKATPTNYITELRLNYAAKLILTTSMPVTDICFECGFNSLAWFYELFANQFKMTPREYREKILYDEP